MSLKALVHSNKNKDIPCSLPDLEVRPPFTNNERPSYLIDITRKIYSKRNVPPNIPKSKSNPGAYVAKSLNVLPDTKKSRSNDGSLNNVSVSNPDSSRVYAKLQRNKENNSRAKAEKTSKVDKYIPSIENLDLKNGDDESESKIQAPKISAKCWSILDASTGQLLFSRKERRKRQMASLTKMMTLLCVCKLLKQYNINPKELQFEVSKVAGTMRGTSACLKPGDILTVWDLLHGLMLPSGNDAAQALAENFGSYIYENSEEYRVRCERSQTPVSKVASNPLKYFVRMMNETAKDLEMTQSQYANPHGLVNDNNYSTAADQAKLSHHVIQWNIIKEIVNTQLFTSYILQSDGTIRKTDWENTNKLLGKQGWSGVKTGVTTAAGPCLSAYYEINEEKYVIILLGSMSMEVRWVEAPQLVEWAIENKVQLKAMLNKSL